jgi:hypothetical protein
MSAPEMGAKRGCEAAMAAMAAMAEIGRQFASRSRV